MYLTFDKKEAQCRGVGWISVRALQQDFELIFFFWGHILWISHLKSHMDYGYILLVKIDMTFTCMVTVLHVPTLTKKKKKNSTHRILFQDSKGTINPSIILWYTLTAFFNPRKLYLWFCQTGLFISMMLLDSSPTHYDCV